MKGSIVERSPSHFAIILETVDRETRKRRRKWHSFKGTKREAQIECSRLITELKGGRYLEPSKITLAQFLERWLERIRPNVTPRTHERYSDLVNKNIIPLLGDTILSRLQPMQVVGRLRHGAHQWP
jgi:integrase-like protein